MIMKSMKRIAVIILLGIVIVSCGPSKSEIATSEAETQAAIDALSTEVAGTEQAIQAEEEAAEQTATAEYNQGATKTANIELAGTRRAGTAEAEIAAQTQAASSMYDKIAELAAYDYISSDEGIFIDLGEFSEDWAQINWYSYWSTGIYPTNFVIRADTSWDSASDNANWFNSGCGFVFRTQDDNDDHYLAYLGLDGNVYFIRWYQGNWKRLGSSWYGNVDIPAGSASVMLVVEGDSFTFFVNDERVRTQVDSAIKDGDLALTLLSGTNAGYGTRCTMENIELWVMD
jgi:hypothetical protein